MKNYEIFTSQENDLKQALEYYRKEGFRIIVKCKDNFLSGWGLAQNKTHIQFVACKDYKHALKIMNDMEQDNTTSYINYWFINDTQAIANSVRGAKTWTIRTCDNWAH